MNTTNNTILITGGTSGIGLAFAEEFLRLGNTVIICGRREERLNAMKEKYPKMITKQSDVSKEQDREELSKWVMHHHPDVNVLINNAGIQLNTSLNDVKVESLRAEVETNFIAPIQLASLFTPHFITKKEAAIINITSGLAFVPLSFMPVYCATKAALHSMTLSLRHQLKNTTVKVFEIAPPAVDTELGQDRREDKSQSHGGIPVEEFLTEAMEAIKNDLLEAPIGQAKGLRMNSDKMFGIMNK